MINYNSLQNLDNQLFNGIRNYFELNKIKNIWYKINYLPNVVCYQVDQAQRFYLARSTALSHFEEDILPILQIKNDIFKCCKLQSLYNNNIFQCRVLLNSEMQYKIWKTSWPRSSRLKSKCSSCDKCF